MSATSPAPRPRLTGPDAVTLSRFPLAVALSIAALAGTPRTALVALACMIAATDVADGAWARAAGTSSARGVLLDSRADAAAAAALAVSVAASCDLSLAAAWWALIATLAAARAAIGVAARRERGSLAAAHTWSNKAAGAACVVAAVAALATGTLDGPATWMACVVATLAAADEALLVARGGAGLVEARGGWVSLNEEGGG